MFYWSFMFIRGCLNQISYFLLTSNLILEYDKVAKGANEVEERKNAIYNEICESNNKRLKPIQQSLEKLTNSIEETSKKITKLKVSLTTSKR